MKFTFFFFFFVDHNMDNTEWNEAKFLNIIKQTNFSEDEVQHLTDALNSKVKGNPAEKKVFF